MEVNIDFQTILGILVSVILFLIGYWQTVGAKKERVRIANNDIQQIILKRIVLESYTPTLTDLSRLIDGKARDHQVEANELLSPIQVLITIFTRIVESDFIGTEQRDKILGRLNPVIIAAEEEPLKEIVEIDSFKKAIYTRIISLLIIAIISSMIGSLLFLIPKDAISFREISIVFILSILIISLFAVIIRIKESQEEPSKSSTLEDSINFEKEVGELLDKFGMLRPHSYREGFSQPYDYYTEINGKRTIIEVKAWPKNIPIKNLQRTFDQLKQVLESGEVDEAIIVTKNTMNLPPQILQNIPIRIMAFKEFRNYLTHSKKIV